MTRATRMFLPAVFALPLIVAAAGAGLLWRSVWTQAQTEIAHVADAAAEYAQGLLSSHAQFLDDVDTRLDAMSPAEFRAREPSLHAMLQAGVATRPMTRRASILDANGATLVSSASLPVSPGPAPPEHGGLAALVARPGRPYGISPLHGMMPDGGEPIFSILRRRESRRPGDPDSLLAVSLSADAVGGSLDRLAAGSGDSIALMHAGDASLLARSAGLPAAGARQVPADSPVAQAVLRRQVPATLLQRSPFDGTWRLTSIRAVGDWPIMVVAGRPRAAILSRWLDAVTPLAVLGLLASAALALLARLVRSAQAALSDANAGLERRVAERTVELAERSQDLARNEERLRLATEAAKLGIWELDIRTGIVRRSALTLAIFGYDSEAEIAIYPSWRDRIHPDDRDETQRIIGAGVAGEVEHYTVAYRFERPDGRLIWIESHGKVVERDRRSGEPLRLAGTSQDITARKEAEARQVLLMREVDHRAKNALAVVTAALRLTPREDPERFAALVEGRVAALARAHTLLAQGHWTGAELRRVIEGELAPFLGRGEDGPHARLDGPSIRLQAATVQGVSMLVHELATNAAKHGALSVREGHLTIRWDVLHDEDGEPRLRLVWRETGGPPLRGAPRRRGFGTSLIEATVLQNLGGEAEARWETEGLVWSASMPLHGIGAEERDADPA